MKRAIVCAALSVFLGSIALAQKAQPWKQEPDSFRDVPFGSTEAETNQKLADELSCFDVGPYGRTCSGGFSIGDVGIKNSFWFDGDHLAHVSIQFDSHNYDYLKDVFIQKYGPPRNRKSERLQNRMGVKGFWERHANKRDDRKKKAADDF